MLDAHIYTCLEKVADKELIRQDITRRLDTYRVYQSMLALECNKCREVCPIKTHDPPH
ncbi:MAG TPA: hypothetical protein HA264_02600 [Methanolinea sp.]|nr:hypothetical protein [Methanolinea sp.]